MAPQRWRFAPFGMVKIPQVPNFQKLKTSVLGDGSYWQGDGVKGRPRIHLVLREQWAYFYKPKSVNGKAPNLARKLIEWANGVPNCPSQSSLKR
jgi:hypothetical protein